MPFSVLAISAKLLAMLSLAVASRSCVSMTLSVKARGGVGWPVEVGRPLFLAALEVEVLLQEGCDGSCDDDDDDAAAATGDSGSSVSSSSASDDNCRMRSSGIQIKQLVTFIYNKMFNLKQGILTHRTSHPYLSLSG